MPATPQPPKPTADEPAAPAPRRREPLRGVRDMWQLPTLLIGAALLLTGVAVWVRGAPGPDFESVLADVRALLERQDYTEALDTLNGPILREIGRPEAPPEVRAEFHALRGDAIYLAQRVGEPPAPEAARVNYGNVLQEYDEARAIDEAQITPRRRAFIAESLLELGRRKDALREIQSLPDEEAERRHRLMKRIINEQLATATPDATREAQALLEQLRADPLLSDDDRLWARAREASIRLAGGFPDRVIDDLLPQIQRLDRRDTRSAGELLLLLGRAYLELGEMENARETLSHAELALPPGDALRGQADVLLARIAQSLGETEEARDRFASVVERFPGTPTQLQGLLGLGETEGDLGRTEDSLKAYTELVSLLPRLGGIGSVSADEASESIRQRHRARTAESDFASAVEYAELIVRAFPEARLPPAEMVRLAESHLSYARSLMGEKPEGEDAEEAPVAALDPVTLENARVQFARASERFAHHTRLATVSDPEAAANSLWKAADAADRAGNQDRAIQLFTQFVQARRNDPRQFEGRWRLARAFQARGEFQTAIGLFEEIIRTNPGSDEAYRSYVPLAQCHLLTAEAGGEEKAERWLQQVIQGRMFEPSSPQYRDGLIELGRLYLRSGRHAEAIERLDEVLRRYTDAPDRTRLVFDLADACRLSAGQIERRLRESMPLTERSELEQARLTRLERALELYARARAEIEAREPGTLGELDRVLLRNTIFYRADCAFDLGDFDAAIKHYDAAAQRYADDPASLVAMVQIVNCYAALGKWREARTAHERAKARLRELPDNAWGAHGAPMDRRHWERWLEASLRLEHAGDAAIAEGE